MQIVNITDRLFQVESILPQDLVADLLALDWQSVPWARGLKQEHWSRRNLNASNIATLEQVQQYIWQAIPQIETHCNIEFDIKFPATQWWLDEPGFDVDIHTDGEMPGSIQLFWYAPGPDWGTVFYNSKQQTDVLYQFPFVANTGYMMLNCPNPDGSQPLQWHGMLNTVPLNTYRVTSYTNLSSYHAK
jgi:hypothetical protein